MMKPRTRTIAAVGLMLSTASFLAAVWAGPEPVHGKLAITGAILLMATICLAVT